MKAYNEIVEHDLWEEAAKQKELQDVNEINAKEVFCVPQAISA